VQASVHQFTSITSRTEIWNSSISSYITSIREERKMGEERKREAHLDPKTARRRVWAGGGQRGAAAAQILSTAAQVLSTTAQ
jgi:hypothetical protein